MSSSPSKTRRPRRKMAVVTLLRRVGSTVASDYTISGRRKERHARRVPSMPVVKCLLRDVDQ
jgi:hypothetical protein